MELQDIKLEEIAPFFDSLGHEKELVMMNAAAAMTSRFIAGARAGDDLAGITGIRISYGFLPALFIVVKSKYQGMNLGNQLMEKNLDFARRHYSYLTLSTEKNDEYNAALHLYQKHGFKHLYRRGNRYWMYISFNGKGEMICRLLPLVFPVLPYLYAMLTGQIFVAAYRRLRRRSVKQHEASTSPEE